MRGSDVLDPMLPAPNFFIVGAAKAGTTSLHAYLSKHPDVFMSALKEPHYFASFELKPEFDNFLPVIRDLRSYQELFRGSEDSRAVGESSPSYLCDPDAATLIKSAIPDAKIIISLRNPVQRAFSHYLMEYHAGRESLPFEEAVQADLSRSEKGWGRSFQYVELGLYADQVERYLSTFGRSRVSVILFEDLIRKTPTVMSDIATFLGINPSGYPQSAFDDVYFPFEATRSRLARRVLRWSSLRHWSRNWVPQEVRRVVRNRLLYRASDKPQLKGETRKALASRFESDLLRLEGILARDLSVLRQNE